MNYITTHAPEGLMVIRILLPKSNNPPSRPNDNSFDVSTLVAPVNPLLRESGVPGDTLSFADDENIEDAADVAGTILVLPEVLLLWL